MAESQLNYTAAHINNRMSDPYMLRVLNGVMDLPYAGADKTFLDTLGGANAMLCLRKGVYTSNLVLAPYDRSLILTNGIFQIYDGSVIKTLISSFRVTINSAGRWTWTISRLTDANGVAVSTTGYSIQGWVQMIPM